MASWTAVDRINHINKRWRPRDSFNFAATQQVAEVLIPELSRLLPEYVLGFVKEGDKYQFIALLSLGGDRNLYVNKENKWMGHYVPTAMRGYPFTLADNSETEERILCITESHLTDDTNSNALFDDEGELAPETATLLNFLQQCDNSRNQTQTACNALAEAGVIEPWKLKVKTSEVDEEPQPIEGIYRINEDALNKLFKPVLIRLREAGALPLAYAQLFSMERLRQLGRRGEYIALQQETADRSLDLKGLFDEEGSLNFDAL